MAKLERLNSLAQINIKTIESYPRPHLGASVIGHACTRYLVYSFNWAYKNKISGKLNRIFSLGDKVEDIIIDALRSADRDWETGTSMTNN